LKDRHKKKEEEEKKSEGGFFGGLLDGDSPEEEMEKEISVMRENLEIEFENPLLYHAIKMCIFFSEILPKKYFG